MRDGRVLGAVGVSGAKAEEDEEIARPESPRFSSSRCGDQSEPFLRADARAQGPFARPRAVTSFDTEL
ncbi:MAG: hypothetical protein ACXWC3_19745 [Burkholderiales bacterium]